MNRRDEYVTITATLTARTDRAAQLSNSDAIGWVPRSCMHFMSDKAVAEAAIGDELELRIMEWIADERGFI